MQGTTQRSQRYPFDFENLSWLYAIAYGQEEGARRARNAVDDAARIGLKLVLNLLPFHEEKWVPFYTFGECDFSTDNLEKSVADTQRAVGFGLSWGDIHVLSEVCELGRGIWGDDWGLRFRDRLLAPADHLATLEELWWLGLWRSPSQIQYEVSLAPSTRKKVDWRFTTCDQKVNLEVKLRPKDWKRVSDGSLHSNLRTSVFEGIAEKFPVRNKAEINLAAITLLAPLDRETDVAGESFVKEHDSIDGVVFWSTGTGDRSPASFHLKPECGHVRLCFHIKPEKRYRFTLILHPWGDREKRRAKWLGIEEDIATLDGIFNKVGRLWTPR